MQLSESCLGTRMKGGGSGRGDNRNAAMRIYTIKDVQITSCDGQVYPWVFVATKSICGRPWDWCGATASTINNKTLGANYGSLVGEVPLIVWQR